VVAGIAKFYSAEELVGMKVIIVANLKPAKLMGVTSQGMVLAAKEQDADGNERLVLSTVSADIAAGSRVA
jgi:methionyl-tRNA synthetase